MGIEIERKFLVGGLWNPVHNNYKNVSIQQGYLSVDPERTVRIHISDKRNLNEGKKPAAKICVKGITVGATRSEFEYSIPLEDAKQLLKLCVGRIITKTRYFVMEDGSNVEDWKSRYFEVDVFSGHLAGLVVAEIELANENDEFLRPLWIKKEVTDDLRYYNANMAMADGPPR